MTTRTQNHNDSYDTLASKLCETAQAIARRRSAPIAIGNWECATGYSEGIYMHQGQVWYEYAPRGTWAAYDKSAMYEHHQMDAEELAIFLRRVAFSDSQEMIHLMQKTHELNLEARV